MKFRNISQWQLSKGIEGLLFFAQRFNELLFDYTLDSYKPSALNAPYLAQEAVNLTKEIESGLIDAANLEPVLEELEWAIQHDSTSKRLLDAGVEFYILLGESVKHSEQKLRLEVLAQTLEPYRYLLACIDDLYDAIKKNSKKLIESHARSLATTLINMGVSKQHLGDVLDDSFFNYQGDAIASVDYFLVFIDRVKPIAHNFDLYFIATSLIKEISDSIVSLDAEIVDKLPEELEGFAKSKGFLKNPNEVYVHIDDIRAYDKYSARDEAIRTLENLSNLFTIFHHKSRIFWRPEALANQCCAPGMVLVPAPKSAMDKVADMRPGKASKELNRLITTLPMHNPSSVRLMRVADLHGICVSHPISENQLVNIWTALETLIPSNLANSKIVNITNAMLPFLMKAYVGRIIERFTYDILIWNNWLAKKILKKVPSTAGASLVQRATDLLTIKDNEDIRKELYVALRDFHLLRHRAFQLSEILSDPRKIEDLLNTHEKKVTWQLRRIYRTRNLIVHSGRFPSYLPTLIENGHDYLDQVIFDLIKMMCGEYRTDTIEQAFEIAKVLNIKFKRQLDEVKEFSAENNSFLIDKGPAIILA